MHHRSVIDSPVHIQCFLLVSNVPVLTSMDGANLTLRLTNIASLSLIASTYLEKKIGFWAAYLLPLCSVWVLIPLLLVWQKSLGNDTKKSQSPSCVILILQSQIATPGQCSPTGRKSYCMLG